MNRVREQHETHTKYAMAVLSWVLSCAIRPLTVDELRYALAIVMADADSLDREWLPDQGDLASICYGFVVIDQSGILRFAHFLVQEFFDEEKQNGNLFPTALACLIFDDFTTGARPSEQQMRARVNDVPFLCYAATYCTAMTFVPGQTRTLPYPIACPSSLMKTIKPPTIIGCAYISQIRQRSGLENVPGCGSKTFHLSLGTLHISDCQT